MTPEHRNLMMAAIFAFFIFFAVSSHLMYSFTDSVFGMVGWDTMNAAGAPTTFGLVLHSLVYALVLSLVLGYGKFIAPY